MEIPEAGPVVRNVQQPNVQQPNDTADQPAQVQGLDFHGMEDLPIGCEADVGPARASTVHQSPLPLVGPMKRRYIFME